MFLLAMTTIKHNNVLSVVTKTQPTATQQAIRYVQKGTTPNDQKSGK